VNCRDFQHRLDLGLTSGGVRPDEETQAHLESCAACREYHEALVAFAGDAGVLAPESLTAEEAEKLIIAIRREIVAIPQIIIDSSPVRWWQWAIRPVAAAALILMVALMPGSRMSTAQSSDQQLQMMSMTEAEKSDVLPQYLNGDVDQISRLLDQTSAAYITDQVHPSQVEDILDNTSTEELEYMLTNFSAEI
jgi:predicted anti-sigma-YlaC factor YlaD